MDKRNLIQIVVAFLCNANIKGFFDKSIYKGNFKKVCVPGLNCYACPGAVGSCPIGAIQAVAGGRAYNFSFFAVGFLIVVGVIIGRLVCGFLCPFGLFQDLLYKIPTKKFEINRKVHSKLIYLKYFFLFGVVFLATAFITNIYKMSSPYFCEFICPVGTLEGGIPLTLSVSSLRSSIGLLFFWKVFILISIILLSIFTYRPFCKYICPLGAFYGIFNKISFFKYNFKQDKCTNCNLCEKSCKMNIEPRKDCNSAECIRCGNCVNVCKTKALTHKIEFKK